MATEKITYKIDVEGNAKQQLDNAKKSIDKFNESMRVTSEDGKRIKTDLNAMKNELVGLSVAGQKGSATYQFLAKEAAILEDVNRRVAQEVQFHANSYKKLEAGIKMVQGIGGAFQATNGIVNLFGIENEKVTESIRRMMAIQQTMNGVQQMANMLKKEYNVGLLLQNTRTKALILTQKLYTAAVGKTVGAMKLLRLAMISTGVLALVAGIGTLIAVLMRLRKATDEQSTALKEQRDAIEKLNTSNNDRLNQLNNEIDKLKDLGKTEEELNDERMRGLRIQMTNQSFLNKSKERKAAEAKADWEAAIKTRDENTDHRYARENRRAVKAAKAAYDKTKEDLISGSTTFSEFQQELRQLEAIQKSIQKEKENTSTIKNRETQRLVNQAPKTFNVYINELGNIDNVNLISEDDEESFRSNLIRTLTGALQTIQLQNT